MGAGMVWHEPRRTMWSRRLDYTSVSVWLGAVAVLGLDKDAGDFGERCLDLALDTGDRRLDIDGAASVVEIEAEGGQHLVRAEMHGQHLIGADDAWCHLGDALDFGARLRVHCLAGDLLPVPSPLRRDRAHCQARRLPWC